HSVLRLHIDLEARAQALLGSKAEVEHGLSIILSQQIFCDFGVWANLSSDSLIAYFDRASCFGLNQYHQYLIVIVQIIIGAISALRVYAIYACNRLVLALITSVGLGVGVYGLVCPSRIRILLSKMMYSIRFLLNTALHGRWLTYRQMGVNSQ
ncbi:hypothetical protein CVT26_007501, partial [Gymnopilus dilepis]